MAVVSDTIADMLTRIRNANQMRYKTVEVPEQRLQDTILRRPARNPRSVACQSWQVGFLTYAKPREWFAI